MSHAFSPSQSITSFRLLLHSVLFGSFSLPTVSLNSLLNSAHSKFFNLVMIGLRVSFVSLIPFGMEPRIVSGSFP